MCALFLSISQRRTYFIGILVVLIFACHDAHKTDLENLFTGEAVPLNKEAKKLKFEKKRSYYILIFNLYHCDVCLDDFLNISKNTALLNGKKYLTLLVDGDKTEAKALVRIKDITGPAYWYPRPELLPIQIETTPLLIFINERGEIFQHGAKTVRNREELLNFVEKVEK